ncbi:MAG: fibronectin type III domain-containing protein, partial [Clostridiales bacterium]|nr:fibronectin type III domain-containing protein [Clostridiales bacterium]
ATCSATGVKTYTCTVCGATKTETIAKTAHTYDSGKVTKAATCSATGVKTYTCTVCGATKTETIAKTAHTYKNIVTKATLSKNGKITPTCSVCGATKSATTIYYPKTIKLSSTSYTYDGKAHKPSLTIKDSKGNKINSKYYTVTYSNSKSKSVGKYTVTIKFKGNYSGTKTLTYTIKPKSTSISKITAKSKGFTVKWKKQATQTTGYQIQYSTSKDFSNAKTVTVSKTGTTSKTISKLKSKKKYYVRVRTYKTVKVNGKSTKIYSSWSKTQKITTKK